MNDHVRQTLPLLSPRTKGMYLTLGAEISARCVGKTNAIDDELCYQLALSALQAVEWRSLDAARAALLGPGEKRIKAEAARPGYGPARRSPWTGDYIH